MAFSRSLIATHSTNTRNKMYVKIVSNA